MEVISFAKNVRSHESLRAKIIDLPLCDQYICINSRVTFLPPKHVTVFFMLNLIINTPVHCNVTPFVFAASQNLNKALCSPALAINFAAKCIARE